MQLKQLLNIVASGTKVAIYVKHSGKKLDECYSSFVYGGRVEQVERSHWFQNNESATVDYILADEYFDLMICLKAKKYIYIVNKCYRHEVGFLCSYEQPMIEKFTTEEAAMKSAKKYAYLLSDNELNSVERHVVWEDGTIEFDESIALISNKDGE